MKLHRAMGLADRTLHILERALKAHPSDEELLVHSYRNGRENGYAVSVWTGTFGSVPYWTWTFSENRNSDDVVIYEGDYHLTFGGMRSMNEEEAERFWKTRQYFRTPSDAAKWLVEKIVKADKVRKALIENERAEKAVTPEGAGR
jgi:hypothetical protein